MFETIVKTYENKSEDPLFLFGVSMQNHGGYDYDGEDFSPSVALKGLDGEYPAVEQYLSVLHETDTALAYLISYFENVSEDVVIVFFGDHQPKLSEAFYSEISDADMNSLQAQQTRFKVPFFIWANYDLPAEYVECTSLNYLSSYVYEAAGIPLPPYNQFLAEMETVIPSINANGFYSMDTACYLPFQEASANERSWLLAYEQLQYNSIFDETTRNEHFFPTLE